MRPERAGALERHSDNVEQVRRQELRAGGAATSTPWLPVPQAGGGTSFAEYSVRYGLVVLSGTAEPGYLDFGTWWQWGLLPEDATPSTDEVFYGVSTILGPGFTVIGYWMVPLIVTATGMLLIPKSELISHVPTGFGWDNVWTHSTAPALTLYTAYFPLA